MFRRSKGLKVDKMMHYYEVTGLRLGEGLQLHAQPTVSPHSRRARSVQGCHTNTNTYYYCYKITRNVSLYGGKTSLPLLTLLRVCFVLLGRFISREQSQKVPREVFMPRPLPSHPGHC